MKQKQKTDRELADAIFKAWAAVGKALEDAGIAGLEIDARGFDVDHAPLITRTLYHP